MTGRWPSRDPIEEGGGVNVLAFVENNSVCTIDVLGLAPGDPCKTIDQAAYKALKEINNKSRDEDREYGGWIIEKKNKDGNYTYSEAKYTEKKGFDNKDGVDLGKPPDGAVAGYHTHGQEIEGDSSPEWFSTGTEPSDEDWAKFYEMYLYVATPEGAFGKMLSNGSQMFMRGRDWASIIGEKQKWHPDRKKGEYTHPHRLHPFK
jgi:hypothetical protein